MMPECVSWLGFGWKLHNWGKWEAQAVEFYLFGKGIVQMRVCKRCGMSERKEF